MLGFYFPNGEYSVSQEYYTYSVESYIADVGGYLVRFDISTKPQI